MVRNFVAFGRPPEFFKKAQEEVAALKPDDDSLKAWRTRAPLLNHHQWMAGEIARARLRQQWAGLFREFDVVLCPPFSVVAFPHDQKPDQEQRTIDIDGEAHPYLSLIVWSTVATPPGCRRPSCRWAVPKPVFRSACRSSAPCSKTAPRSRLRACWSENSEASPGRRKCNFDLTFPEGDPVRYPRNSGSGTESGGLRFGNPPWFSAGKRGASTHPGILKRRRGNSYLWDASPGVRLWAARRRQ